jgi:glycosyltransferase involved in cell wall biosynthesis
MAKIVSHGIIGMIKMEADGALVGWAYDPSVDEPLGLALTVDGTKVATAFCNAQHHGAALHGGGQCGFDFEMPASCFDGQVHIVQLRTSDNRLIMFRDTSEHEEPEGVQTDDRAFKPNAAGELTGHPACGFVFLHDKVNRLGTTAPLNFFITPGETEEARRGKTARVDAAPLDAADAIALLRDSGLFDEDYYLTSNPDVVGADLPPLAHFYGFGYREGRKPNRYFDPAWYASQHKQAEGMQPLLHFLLRGDAQGCDPGPNFQVKWFRERYGLARDENTLAHYLRAGRDEHLSPVKEFDAAYYAAQNPDVVAAGIDLFEHFFNYGYKELRNPSADFDVKFYVQRYLKGDYSKNPLLHFRAHRQDPAVRGRPADDEITVAREMKRYCQPGQYFEEVAPALPGRKQAMLLAYYLPQFHSFAENDAWWGKGFTEWTNLIRGAPRFAGHYQPRVPRDLGFYTLDSTEPMRRQIELAKAGGVSGFVFYTYWFNGKRLMEQPVSRFLADRTLDMKFALMWANENWTRRWDGTESEVLISQDYRAEDDLEMAGAFAAHFKDDRYIRLQGRPLLMIYRADVIPETKAAIARWRGIFREYFKEDPIFVMAQAFDAEDPREFGFDGAVEFPPHKLTRRMPAANADFTYLDPDFTGKILHYDDVVAESLKDGAVGYPLIKTAIPSWDNDARRQGAGMTIAGSTPPKYEAWLAKLVENARMNPFFGTPLVCVNAWNEWCEGTYLEPDLHFGGAYLNATARAVAGRARGVEAPRLLLVGHDAFAGGAQQLLLNIGRVLKADFGVELEFLLLAGGALEDAYRGVAPLSIAANDAALSARLERLAQAGFTGAVVNTLAAGRVTAYLRAARIEPVLLVHELPRILREKQLGNIAAAGLKDAQTIVFPAPFVRDAVLKELGAAADERMLVMPQGSYKRIVYDKAGAARIRASFGMGREDALVLGAGYADLRKGFDLFLQLWRTMNAGRRVHFIWVGGIDPGLKDWLGDEIAAAEATGTFKMAGYREDMAAFFSAASAFVLTSREDPLPSVVMEALGAGAPVAVFEGSGGMPDVLRDIEEGEIVPYGDVPAMARAVHRLVLAGITPASRKQRHGKIARKFDFTAYAHGLIKLALPGLRDVSVAVPNYNYARHIKGRLGSIFGQTYPVREVIVLDDASRDNSVAVISQAAAEAGRGIRLVVNERNAGSVFAQWRRAAEMAVGEFVWIAEADDLAEPAFLARMAALLARDENMALAFSDSRTMHEDGSPQWPSYKEYYATIEPGSLRESAVFEGAVFARRFMAVKNLIVNASAVVWRRDALLAALEARAEELAGFRMAGDWMLYLTALAAPGARIGYEAQPVNIHRRHEASVTHLMDQDRHVTEIARCQAFARKMLKLTPEAERQQTAYRDEVAAQLARLSRVPAASRNVKPAVVYPRKSIRRADGAREIAV